MSQSEPKPCHTIVTQPCASLKEWVAVAHHIAAALAAFGEAKSAPDKWHRDRAMGRVFCEVDAAESRLVALIEREPGIRSRCRSKMVEIDGFVGQVHAWAATLPMRTATVIDFPALRPRSATKARRKAENRPRVNENLRAVTDTAPTAC